MGSGGITIPGRELVFLVPSGIFFGGPMVSSSKGKATFVSADTSTQGNWRSVYGADGYNVAGDINIDPSYAAPAISGESSYLRPQPLA